MPRRVPTLSLAFLTIPDVSPVAAVEIAATAGFNKVGLRLLPATTQEQPYPLLDDRKLLREVQSALRNTGVLIGDLELLRIDQPFDSSRLAGFFEVAAALDATDITVIVDDEDVRRSLDQFAQSCETARPYGLTLNLEPIPWTAIRDLDQAISFLASASQPNVGILIDAFHFYRRHGSIASVQSIPMEWLRLFQLCDAPKAFDPNPDSIRHEARTARVMPGDGELDLESLLRSFPEHTTVSVEVPNQDLIARQSPAQRAQMAFDKARQALKKAWCDSYV